MITELKKRELISAMPVFELTEKEANILSGVLYFYKAGVTPHTYLCNNLKAYLPPAARGILLEKIMTTLGKSGTGWLEGVYPPGQLFGGRSEQLRIWWLEKLIYHHNSTKVSLKDSFINGDYLV